MGNLFSAISGQFGKPLVLGTLLPVTVALLLLLALVSPAVPTEGSWLSAVAGLGGEWKVIALSIAAVLLSGLVYSLNTPIIRFYEGYPWHRSWIGEQRIRRFQRELDVLLSRRKNLLALLDGLEDKPSLEGKVSARLGRVAESLKRDYPTARSSVLPTRLGNAVRSFENYPRDQYGMSAIPLWPRLVAVIPEKYAAAIDDAKTTFDFMINGSLLAGCLTVAVVALNLPEALSGQPWAASSFWLVESASLAAVSYLFYRLSISQATAWGSLIRGAFDLYRWELLEKMGYGQKPETRSEERELWSKISRQVLFGDDDSGPWIDSYGASRQIRVRPVGRRTREGSNGD
jgi:hypothetical protein